jgi:hypothetical protein
MMFCFLKKNKGDVFTKFAKISTKFMLEKKRFLRNLDVELKIKNLEKKKQ